MSTTAEITAFVQTVAEKMGLQLTASAEEMPDGLRINLDGEDGGLLIRRQGEALAALPLRDVADRVLARYFRPEGRGPDEPYDPTPRPGLRPNRSRDELGIAGNFAEVWLAKQGHDGLIGINFLEKIQMATPWTLVGAMLAGVDVVLMGAGIPREIPRLLDDLATGAEGSVEVTVHGGTHPVRATADPRALLGELLPPLRRPQFLAIVSLHHLASYLHRDPAIRPDGFVVEGPVAGGHSTPPRGRLKLDDDGQPIYDVKDLADLQAMTAIGLPYWLPLAMWTGVVAQFVPTIGTYIAITLPVLVGLLSPNPWLGVIALAWGLLYQQVENLTIEPKISAKAVDLHPAVSFGAVMFGASLFGAAGALLAVPVAAIVMSFLETYAPTYDVVEDPAASG